MEDRCVCCGNTIPEGMQVCPSHIKDSGNRRKFETGAVRDIQEGKGRCDLMPLGVIAEIMEDTVLKHLANFQMTGGICHLHEAVKKFSDTYSKDISETGKAIDYEDYKQCEADMFLEVSKHFEQGALKYGENNWQKGIPVHCYLDSAVRHYLKWCRGDEDESHDRAFVWNIICCLWTIHNKPEMYDAKVGDSDGK